MSLVRGGILVSVAEYGAMALGLARAMMLSRALGPEGVGQLRLIRHTVVFAAQAASLGLPMASVYAINKQKRDPSQVLVTSVYAFLATSALAGLAILLLLTRLSNFFGQLWMVGIIACVAFIPLVLVRNCFEQLNLAKMRIWSLVALRVIPEVVLTAVVTVLYFPGLLEVNLMVALDVLLPIFGLLVGYLTLRTLLNLRTPPDWEYLRSGVPLGLQISASGFLIVINGYLSMVLLRLFKTPFEALGYFSQAVLVASLVVMAANGILRLLYSRWASLDGQRRREDVQRTASVATAAAVVGCLVVFLLVRWVMVVFFTAKFLPAVPVTRILLAGVVGYLLARVLMQLFVADGKPRYNILTLASGIASNLGLCLMLIPRYGELGAAVASLVCYWVMAGVAMYIGRSRYGLEVASMLIPSRSALRQAMVSLRRPAPPGPEANQDSASKVDANRLL